MKKDKATSGAAKKGCDGPHPHHQAGRSQTSGVRKDRNVNNDEKSSKGQVESREDSADRDTGEHGKYRRSQPWLWIVGGQGYSIILHIFSVQL